MQKLQERIEWVDIFKAITIISVVVGHTTVKYHFIIYQMHMAAFFFISGYTTNLKNRNLLSTIWNKSCTMLLPFGTVFVIGLIFVSLLDLTGLYDILFEKPFIGVPTAIYQIIFHGVNYVVWMSATWFIVILFETVVLQKAVHYFWGSKANWGYIISITLLFLLGYLMVYSDIKLHLGIFTIDLLLIAQLYFGAGVVFNEYNIFQKLSGSVITIIVTGCISIMLVYYFGIVNLTKVDYPSRMFKSPLLEAIAAINGTVFIYLLSTLVDKIPKIIKNIFTFIGKNTLGILFFHFMFFKISFVILYMLGIIPFTGLRSFIPTLEIGQKFWWLFTLISIPFSILLWKLLTGQKHLNSLLGENKEMYSDAFNKIIRLKFFQRLNAISFDVDDMIFFIKNIKAAGK